MYTFKLFVLRLVLIVVIDVCIIATKFTARDYHYPLIWLNHYLKGSGKPLKIEERLVILAATAIVRAIHNGGDGLTYCVNHSTLYEGYGFHGRPTLFYLIGGFTFHLTWISDNLIRIYGSDHYDWHATTRINEDGEEEEFYFTSPLGSNKYIKFIIKILDKIFGNELFINNCIIGNPDDCAISNKLWEELKKVGAKEFYSTFVATINLLKEDISYIHNEFEYYDYNEWVNTNGRYNPYLRRYEDEPEEYSGEEEIQGE